MRRDGSTRLASQIVPRIAMVDSFTSTMMKLNLNNVLTWYLYTFCSREFFIPVTGTNTSSEGGREAPMMDRLHAKQQISPTVPLIFRRKFE